MQAPPDTLTAQAVECLKEQYGNDTAGLTKAIAGRLFLAGERPTRARVRDFTQQGSFSTIDRAMREWWVELRDQTQARIEIPDVPEALIEPFGQAVHSLWEIAHAQASATFDEARANAAAELDAAKVDVATVKAEAEQAAQAATESLQAAQQEIAAVRARSVELERRNADLLAKVESTSSALTEAREAARAAEAAHEATMAQRDAEAREAAAERQREREILEGQLAFATQRIEEAREHSREQVALVEHERKRNQTLEQKMDLADKAHKDAMEALRTRSADDLRALRDRLEAAERAMWSLSQSKAQHEREQAERLAEIEAGKIRLQAMTERAAALEAQNADARLALEAAQQRIDKLIGNGLPSQKRPGKTPEKQAGSDHP